MLNGKTQPDPVAPGHANAQTLPNYQSAPKAAVRKATKKALVSLDESAHQQAAMTAAPIGGESPARLALVQVIKGMIGGAQCLVVDGRDLHGCRIGGRTACSTMLSALTEKA